MVNRYIARGMALGGILLILSTPLFAQSKISPTGKMCLQEYNRIRLTRQADHTDTMVKAIVVLHDASFADSITSEGFVITAHLGKTILVDTPMSRIEYLSHLSGVKYVSFGEKQEPLLDYARTSANVSQVQEGFEYDGEICSFDGSGVICGMIDTGLEASHINFKNPDGSSRIQRLWHMNKSNGSSTLYTADDIATFRTDDENGFHATHVAGIMGGGYKGYARFAYTTPDYEFATINENGEIPYYGVATGSDLALAVGELYDTNVIQGVKNIVDYAQSEGKPCVINISLGNTKGPHDGTDAYSSALSELGKQAIICVAAGNDGDKKQSITKTFSVNETSFKTFTENNQVKGDVDIWGNDNKPFKVKWAVYDTEAQTLTEILSVNDTRQSVTVTDADQTLRAGFSGWLAMTTDINVLNNRFNVFTTGDLTSRSTNTTLKIALVIEGAEEQTVYVYSNSYTPFTHNNLDGWTDGERSNTINNTACAQNVIAVGAYVSRTSWGKLNRITYKADKERYTLDQIAPFSAYGTTFDGRQLPHVCAPGSQIISSYSGFVIEKYNDGINTVASTSPSTSETYYWNTLQGTSMSCPFVSGVVGLWLQADSTLDCEGILNVIQKTSHYDTSFTPAAAWGAGKIDALAGIKYILTNKTGIAAADYERMILSTTPTGYEIFIANATDFTVSLYDLQGRCLTTATGHEGSAVVETSTLHKGIYLLDVRADDLHLTRKIAHNLSR